MFQSGNGNLDRSRQAGYRLRARLVCQSVSVSQSVCLVGVEEWKSGSMEARVQASPPYETPNQLARTARTQRTHHRQPSSTRKRIDRMGWDGWSSLSDLPSLLFSPLTNTTTTTTTHHLLERLLTGTVWAAYHDPRQMSSQHGTSVASAVASLGGVMLA